LKILQQTFSYQSRFLSESSSSGESEEIQIASCEDELIQPVTFCHFIPLHAGFLNQPSSKNYLENVFTSKLAKENDGIQLGNDLQKTLKIYITKGKDEQAANILRNIICSGFMMDSATVNEMKEIFVNSLNAEFENNAINYMDILIYFIRNEEIDQGVSEKNTLVFQLFKDALNKALSRNSELIHRDKVEDKITQTSQKLTQYEDCAALSDLFHFEVAKTLIKRKQYDLLHFVNFLSLSNDRAAKLITKLVISKCYSEAIDLICQSNASVAEPVITGLYKRVSDLKAEGSLKVSDKKMVMFEDWMCLNGFESVVEKLGTAGKEKAKKSYDWNELDFMK
jgi:uncharacterized protein YjgD (DUF1641 family)